MSYQLYQFNLGTGQAQGYVLHGSGEHEGTNESISASELEAALSSIRLRLRDRYADYAPPRGTLLKEKPPVDPREINAVAEFLDQRFKLAHARRMAYQSACVAVAEFARATRDSGSQPKAENGEAG